MAAPRLNPEQMARIRIDGMLSAAGWELQDYANADFAAAPGVAVREFMTATGPLDYLLVADGKVVGSVEAKREGVCSNCTVGAGVDGGGSGPSASHSQSNEGSSLVPTPKRPRASTWLEFPDRWC